MKILSLLLLSRFQAPKPTLPTVNTATISKPHGWSWIDQPMIGDCKDGLNVYAITEPQTISNCYRNDVLIDRLFFIISNDSYT